jgi:hypothetical protein
VTDRPTPLVRAPDKALCKPHFQALIPEHHPSGILWQTRYAIAMVKVTELMLAHPHVQRQCEGQIERATAILSQCVPLCCFLGPEALEQVRQEIADRLRAQFGWSA